MPRHLCRGKKESPMYPSPHFERSALTVRLFGCQWYLPHWMMTLIGGTHIDNALLH